ncbi:MAG: FkbM family methyltransferase [Clostridia bacterium]|nr:FkbM family methyltransferase [Clostridia bacterium]
MLNNPVFSWEKIKKSGKPVLIYGMGNGADKVIDELNRLDIPVLGVTASDAFVRGQQFRGFTVRKLSEFEGDFIIAVAFASSIPDVMEHIFSLSEKYKLLVPCVPVVGNEIINRDFVKKYKDRLEAAYALFDDGSQRIFEGCLEFMLGGELETLKAVTTEKDEVFNKILKLTPDEHYLDLGAYRGDTVDELLRYSGGTYGSIIAVEPDRRTFKKLCEHIDGMPDVVPVQKAIYSFSGTANFNSAAGRQSAIGENGSQIETVTVDELCDGREITYIKMDVEGAEIDAINGARQTLSEKKPKLNIALYHKFTDIFEIPLLIHSINPDYKFHIRRHPYIPCWDLNLYCV